MKILKKGTKNVILGGECGHVIVGGVAFGHAVVFGLRRAFGAAAVPFGHSVGAFGAGTWP
jgi:hypothetical protein